MANGKYQNLSDLARAMGLSISQVYRVREGKRGINEKFIVGAKRAFPNHRLDDLFYFRSGHN
jgi:transcriptional regulator with XRE-family HTH domain